MGRKKVGSPKSVALTPTQQQWITDQGLTTSEAIRQALDAMIQEGPTGHLRELVRQVEGEVLRLQRQGKPADMLTRELEGLWRLVIEG
jgi:16S rRNA U516 pseudouridylate synthase RsuA-like enzyme